MDNKHATEVALRLMDDCKVPVDIKYSSGLGVVLGVPRPELVMLVAQAMQLGKLKERTDLERIIVSQMPIVATVIRFIDRMNDVAPCDPAEKILEEFVEAVMPHIDAYIDSKRATFTDISQGKTNA